MRVLAGDIGGTSARLAIIGVDADSTSLLYKRRFASKDFPGLTPIIQVFLNDVADAPRRACFGIACPVVNGKCKRDKSLLGSRRLDARGGHRDPLSGRALDIFASAYGAQASNLALTVLATGGLYVAGGIAPRILPKLRDGAL